MTEYRIAWLELISSRDDFYLLVILLLAGAAVWYKLSGGRFYRVWLALAGAAVIGLMAAGAMI